MISMKHSALVSVFAAVALGGCAGQTPAPQTAVPAQAGAPVPALGISGVAQRVVDLPAAAGDGDPREVHVLVDEPALKLASIVLRHGAVLAEHQAPVPVTIQALLGAGTVVAGGERLRLDPQHAVVLAASVPHTVEPDAGTDLVLLVHHLGRGEATHP